MRFVLAAAACTAAVLFFPPKAQALPVFAHRYGFSCQQCHTIVPQLNGFGQSFAANGFRLNVPSRGTLPVAVKVNLQYTSDKDTGQNLPKGVVDEIEVLSGGRLGNNASYFVEQYVIDGGKPGATRDAWVQFDKTLGGLGGTENASTLRVRAGQFTLPLPVDPESERPTQQHYAVFDQTVGRNAFDLFDPRIGADLSLSRAATQVHLLALQSYDRSSGVPVSGLDTMAALSHDVNDNLSLYAYRYRGQRHVDGSADAFWRQGYAATYDDRRFGIAALVQTGRDTAAGDAGEPARSSGGFVQARYALANGANVYYRYDRTFDAIGGAAQSNTLSLVLRPRRNYRLTLEATQSGSHTAFTSALLFAY